MSRNLPWRNIRFCTEEETAEIREEFLQRGGRGIPADSPVGYALECTLRFDPHTHDKLKWYPPCGQKRPVDPSEYSPFTKKLSDDYGMKGKPAPKLITCLNEKKSYRLHYMNLKQLVELGVTVVEIVKVVQFDQRPWLEPYIRFNNEQRAKATNSFARDFRKLRNNAVYGTSF